MFMFRIKASDPAQTAAGAPPYRLHCEFNYLKTPPAWIKIAIIILDIIGTICIYADFYSGSGAWFYMVSITGFNVHILLLSLYLAFIPGMFPKINWYLIEAIYCGGWAFLIFTASVAAAVVSTKYTNASGHGAAAFFGFLAMILYATDAVVKFLAVRRGDRAQASNISQQPPPESQPPSVNTHGISNAGMKEDWPKY